MTLTLDAAAVNRLSPAAAVAAITATLESGFDPAADIPRGIIDLAHGQLLVMPTEASGYMGIKVASVAPGNPEQGLPRIQGSYLLYDSATLSLQAILDGTALTTLRTPAVSIAAVKPVLDRRPEPQHVVVFGAGPQAAGHIDTIAGVAPGGVGSATFVLRRPERAGDDVLTRGSVVGLGSEEANLALADADVVVCATSAREPLFDSSLLQPHAIAIAIGSHEVDARELDGALLGRASVIVESTVNSLREGGDVIMAIAEGHLAAEDLIPMRDVIAGAVELPNDRPVVFKSSGMSWQDLSVATAVFELQNG